MSAGAAPIRFSASSRYACWCRCCCCRGGCSPRARRISHRKADPGFVDEGWTLQSAMRHHAFWALFATFFFTAVGMYALAAQIVAYLIDAGFPPLQAATAWGFSGVVLLFGMLGRDATRQHHRPPAVGAAQLRHLDRRHHPALAAAVLSELLAADGFCRLTFGSMIGSRGPLITATALNIFRGERVGTDLRHDLDRQRSWLGIRRMGRRPDP